MSNENLQPVKRVIVYIDGYNLYYGLRQEYNSKYKWLDLQALAESFIADNMELSAVKYFTAITKNNSDTKNRQAIYLKALEVECDKLKIIKGRFLSKIKTCRSCRTTYQTYEEKKTDVNIACHIVNDAYQGLCDVIYIVSGDSDLVPPVEILKVNHPDIKIIIANPPKRKSSELCSKGDSWFTIGKQKLKLSQLPNNIQTNSGAVLNCPDQWK
ncbi:MAG: NYN domain-containing protein [Cocleimonas sp.]